MGQAACTCSGCQIQPVGHHLDHGSYWSEKYSAESLQLSIFAAYFSVVLKLLLVARQK